MLYDILRMIIVLIIGRIIMRIIWNWPCKEDRIAKNYKKYNDMEDRKW